MDFRRISLVIAESVDAWRIIPRAILVLYSTLVFNLYIWYKSIPTYMQEQCDPSVLKVLMELSMSLEEAKEFACSVVDIVGGPTAAQSAFVTTIVGLSTGIFGLYVATGRKWERGLPHDYEYNNDVFPPPPNPYGPHRPNPYGPQRPNPYGPQPGYNNDSPYGPQPGYNNDGPYGPRRPDPKWGDAPLGDDQAPDDTL